MLVNAIHPEQISFKQIKAFLTVAEQRNLTKAAKQRNVTQSALSRTIMGLESAVGEELFIRSSGGLVLTSFGTAFMPYAHRLNTCYVDTLTTTNRVHTQRFVLAGCEIVLPALLPLLLAAKMRGPEIDTTLIVHELASHQVLNEVASGQAALGLCMWGGGHDDLACTPLLNAPLGLLAGPGMALRPTVRTLEDLADVPMARLADDMVLPQLLRSQGAAFGAYANARVISNNMSTIISAVRGGHVATIVSAVAASSMPAKGLQFIPLPHLLPSLQLCIVAPASRASGAVDSSWERAVEECVLSLPWLPCVEPVARPQPN